MEQEEIAELENNFEIALNSFDFKIVRCVMMYMDWEWATARGMDVPKIEEMEASVRRSFSSLIKRNSKAIRSGGFEVERTYETNISISFILESVDSQDLE